MKFEVLYTIDDILNCKKFRKLSIRRLANVLNYKICFTDWNRLLKVMSIDTENTPFNDYAKQLAISLQKKWENERV